jgi:hypothetical protein
MKQVRLVAIGLMLLLVASGCKGGGSRHAVQHKTVNISSADSKCTVPIEQDELHVCQGDDVKWTGGSFEVTFDKGDGSPCNEAPPWPADGSKLCTIPGDSGKTCPDPSGTRKKYRYKITDKQHNSVCYDPSVVVDN